MPTFISSAKGARGNEVTRIGTPESGADAAINVVSQDFSVQLRGFVDDGHRIRLYVQDLLPIDGDDENPNMQEAILVGDIVRCQSGEILLQVGQQAVILSPRQT